MKDIGLEILDSAASRGDLTALRHQRDGVWREWTFARRDHPHAEGEAKVIAEKYRQLIERMYASNGPDQEPGEGQQER